MEARETVVLAQTEKIRDLKDTVCGTMQPACCCIAWHCICLFYVYKTYSQKKKRHCSANVSPTSDLHVSIPLHHQLQRGLGVLDLGLGLCIQHISRVFSIDLQNNVTGLQGCLLCLAALIDLLNKGMSSSLVVAPGLKNNTF